MARIKEEKETVLSSEEESRAKRIISKYIKNLVYVQNIPVKEIAKNIGVSSTAVYDYMDGFYLPKLPILMNLRKYYGLDINALIDDITCTKIKQHTIISFNISKDELSLIEKGGTVELVINKTESGKDSNEEKN